ncbi:MAG: ABC transporter permease [Patescibacteria group bacterium]
MTPTAIIAGRNLLGEKGRLLITVGGVGFAVMLILLMVGLYQGWNTQMTRFLGSIPADLWVGQTGSGDMSHTISILPSTAQATLEAQPDVTQVAPFVGRRVNIKLNGSDQHLYLVGIDPTQFVKPYKSVYGTTSPGTNEIIIDEAFATDQGLAIGDTLDILDKTFKISGISSGGHVLVFSYAFVTMDDLVDLTEFNGFVNYFLVRSSNIQRSEDAIVQALTGVEAIDREDFSLRNSAIIREAFLPILGVLVIVAVAIGIAIIGLMIFTATLEKRREYGVLKAIGYTNSQLFVIALVQSLVAGVIGFVVGSVLAPIVAEIAAKFVGGFIYDLGVRELAVVGAGTLVMSAVAALLPLRVLVSIDPADVFKA